MQKRNLFCLKLKINAAVCLLPHSIHSFFYSLSCECKYVLVWGNRFREEKKLLCMCFQNETKSDTKSELEFPRKGFFFLTNVWCWFEHSTHYTAGYVFSLALCVSLFLFNFSSQREKRKFSLVHETDFFQVLLDFFCTKICVYDPVMCSWDSWLCAWYLNERNAKKLDRLSAFDCLIFGACKGRKK